MAGLQAELDEVKGTLSMLEHTLATLKDAAMLDGVIDAGEQASIDELSASIRQAKKERDEIAADIKAAAAAEKAQEEEEVIEITDDEEEEVQLHDGGDEDEVGSDTDEDADEDISLVQEIAERQIALQQALLNASPAEAEALIEELETVNQEMEEEAAFLAPDPAPVADTDPEPETLAEDLLVLHADLYQEFLNAGDPLNPDLLTAGQENILEEMRTISLELAIEAERSIIVNKNPELADLDGHELDETAQQIEYEKAGNYDEDSGWTDKELEAGEQDDDTSAYAELLDSGDMSDLGVDDLILNAESQHNRLMHIDELNETFVEERISQIAKAYGVAASNIDITKDGDKVKGFSFSAEQSVKVNKRGIVHVDLSGRIVDIEKLNTVSVEGEIALAAVETVASIVAQPVEIVLDIKDLYTATLEYSQDEDGSILPLLATAGMIVIPFTRAGKRVFDVATKIGVKSIPAGELARIVKKGATDDALAEIGLIGRKLDPADDLIGDAKKTLDDAAGGTGKVSREAIEAALDAVRRGETEALSDTDKILVFTQRNDVNSVLLRLKDEGLSLHDIDVSRKDILRWIGDGTQKDLDGAAEMLSHKMRNKLDDADGRAFDDMQLDEVPDDWQNTKPDIEKIYTKDTLDEVERIEIEKGVYEEMGFKGTPKEIDAGIKKLAKLMSQGMQKEFKGLWIKKAKESKAATEKMGWVKERLEEIEEIAKQREALDSSSEAAKALALREDELRGEVNEVARSAFDNVRTNFWRAVSKDPKSAKLLESAGLKVSPKGAAPILESIGQSVTIEHKIRLQDNPLKAIDGDNMTFAFKYENSVLLEQRRKLIEDRFRELGFEGEHPWL